MAYLEVVHFNSSFALLDQHRNDPIVQEGRYNVGYVEHETCINFGKPKVVFSFRVLDYGKYNGAILKRFYNVARLIGKPAKGGNFKPPRRGDFMVEFVQCFHVDPRRLDRLPLSYFSQNILVAKVETVKRTSYNKITPEQMQYSKISELIKVNNDADFS